MIKKSPRKVPDFWKRFVAILVASTFGAGSVLAQVQIQPDELPKKGSAEYFSTRPGAKVLVAVNIWGEVHQPGLHFVSVDSTLADALGAAGGPMGTASVPELRLIRDHHEQYVDLFEKGDQIKIHDHDMIYVDRSVKTDLPLIFGAITTAVSVLTLYFVYKKK